MTTHTVAPTAPLSSLSSSRAVAVARMHLTDRVTLFLMPLGILAAMAAVNLVIWALVPPDGRQTGGAVALWIVLLATAVYAVIRGLPFALGMGSSRRSFVAGTLLTGAVLSVCYGTLVLVLQVLERATDGWWLGGKMFWFPWFEGTAWPVTWLMLVVSLLATFAAGVLLAAAWMRCRVNLLVVGGPAAVLVVGGGAVLLTWRHWWLEFFGWFGRLGPADVLAWSAVAVIVLAAVTRGVLRRYRVA